MRTVAVRDFLESLGLSPAGVDRMLPGAMRVVQASSEIALPELLYTPGRVELVGKHTDYGGGASLVMAVEAGILAAPVQGPEGLVRLEHLDSGESVVFREGGGQWVTDGVPPFWARYPEVLLNRLVQDFPEFRPGGTLHFSSALPEAAGLSSSTAFLVTLFHGLMRMRGPDGGAPLEALMHDRQQRASYLAAVESGRPFPGLGARDGGRREGVGTEGGTQDQAAILLASPGQLLHLSYRPLQVLDQAPLPEGWVVAVGSSGVVARKAGEVREAFNQLSSAVQEAWRQWIEVHGRGSEGIEQAVPHLGAIAARYPSLATDLGLIDWAEERLRPRIRQFATETLIRVPEAMRCMKDGDGEGAAAWIQASHEDAAAVLQHGVPETEALVELARLHGALAASAFGAGFGGSVWALVPPAEAGGFLKRWHAAYVAAYPAHEGGCTFFVSPPGPGAYAGEGPSGSEGP